MRVLASLFFALIFFSNLSNAQDAIYTIEFISNWISASHPTDYPSGSAHWSSIIGTTHQEAAPFIALGMTATDGVEQVAESGGTSIITQEINTLITTGVAYELINGSGLGSGSGTITINDVNVDADFPNISLLTMIAPSPDWLGMIANQKLTDASDNWLTYISVDVYATDSGTDDGVTYISGNIDTNPRQNMSSLENITPFSAQIIGTFNFTLQQVLTVRNNEHEKAISVYPNPSSGKISIKNLGNTILENIEIYSANGKRLKAYKNLSNQKEIEVNSLTSGLYFLKLTSDNGSITKKLVIQ